MTALIATVTFTAGITIPASYINERVQSSDQGCHSSNQKHQVVLSKLAFVTFKLIAMTLSTSASSST